MAKELYRFGSRWGTRAAGEISAWTLIYSFRVSVISLELLWAFPQDGGLERLNLECSSGFQAHAVTQKSHPATSVKLYRLKATENPFSLKGRNADLTSTHRVRTPEMGDTVCRYLWETLSAWGLFFITPRLSQVWSLHLRYITNISVYAYASVHTHIH